MSEEEDEKWGDDSGFCAIPFLFRVFYAGMWGVGAWPTNGNWRSGPPQCTWDKCDMWRRLAISPWRRQNSPKCCQVISLMQKNASRDRRPLMLFCNREKDWDWRIPNFGKRKRATISSWCSRDFQCQCPLLSSPFLQLIFPLYSLPDITFPSLVSHIRISWRCESGVSKLASHCERLLQQQRHSRKLQSPSDIITIEADVSKNRLSTHGATGNWEKLIYKCYIFPVFFANMSESTLLVLPIIWRCLSCCLFIFYYKK